jgi:hypothetical protein
MAAVNGLLDLSGPIGKGIGAAAPALMGAIKAYHGTPHNVDKFDMSKIGTGEGAQAYGHGLYFAENPKVAEEYQKTLSGDVFKVGDKVFDPSTLGHLNVRNKARSGDLDGAIQKASSIAKSDSPVAKVAQKDLETLERIKQVGGLQKAQGNLYEVNLRWPDAREATDPLGPQHFLDWDKPLSEQPASIRAAVQKTKGMLPANAMDDLGGDLSLMYGRDVTPQQFLNTYESLTGKVGSGEEALKSLGIPGIRYLDGMSRGSGGTSNYVMFDDNMIEILSRNGLLGD